MKKVQQSSRKVTEILGNEIGLTSSTTTVEKASVTLEIPHNQDILTPKYSENITKDMQKDKFVGLFQKWLNDEEILNEELIELIKYFYTNFTTFDQFAQNTDYHPVIKLKLYTMVKNMFSESTELKEKMSSESHMQFIEDQINNHTQNMSLIQ